MKDRNIKKTEYNNKDRENLLLDLDIEPERIEGAVERVFFYNEETGWGSFLFARSDCRPSKSVKCSGTIFGLKEGRKLTLTGEFVFNGKYGKQFHVDSYEDENDPSKLKGNQLRNYLASGYIKGIKVSTGKAIYKTFGDESLNIIMYDHKRLTEISGIGDARAELIHTHYVEDCGINIVMTSLNAALKGITLNLASKIYDKWGIEAEKKITENPYILTEIKGIGFMKADEIALRLGTPPYDQRRITNLILYILSESGSTGNVYYNFRELKKETERYISGLKEDEIQTALDTLCSSKKIIIEDERIYSFLFYQREKANAERLLSIFSAESLPCHCDIEKIEKKLGVRYDEGQRQALKMISSDTAGISVLTGGPGTGKTTVTRGIIEMCRQSDMVIKCAAPTGRAARRMYEATGHPAKTLHSLLEAKGQDFFGKSRSNKIDCDILIIDESSMIDNNLLYFLLQAVPDRSRIVFIGDIDQLPSVGPGCILHDLISSTVFPVLSLTTIHRQGKGSLIIDNAHSVNHGSPLQINNCRESDFIYISTENPQRKETDKETQDEMIAKAIVNLAVNEIPEKYGYSIDDIQILLPMKNRIIGTNHINEIIQEILHDRNGTKEVVKGFYEGDRVMQTTNDPRKKVYNGDVGKVVSYDEEFRELIVEFPSSDEKDENATMKVKYKNADLDSLVLAYACTIHKSQGSEYPVVIMGLTYSHYPMLQRNLLYTGITRAKNLCCVLSSDRALRKTILTESSRHRNTTLVRRISEFVAAADTDAEEEEEEEEN